MPASLSYAAVPAPYSPAEEELAAQKLADADSGDDLLVDLACTCCCAVAARRTSKDVDPQPRRKCFSCINFVIVFAACVFCLVVGAVVYSVDLLSHLLALCSNLRIALIVVPVFAGFLWILGTALLWRSYRHRREAHERSYAKASLTQELLPRGINDEGGVGSCSGGGTTRRCTCRRCARCTIAVSFWSIFGILNLAILALFSLLLFMQLHTLPKLSGSIKMGSGLLAASASISRTTEGILHIESHDQTSAARSEYDLFFAQGVAHAQDRLWQMEFQRAVGQGRLGELTGYNEAVVDIDRLSRTMGFYSAAQSAIPHLSQRSQDIIRAYCDGVNQYLASDSLALSVEFYILGLDKPDWWVPADVLVWTKIVSYMLSGNLDNELQRWDLAMLLPDPLDWPRIQTLLPPFDYTRFPFILEGEISEEDMTGYNHVLHPKEEPMMAWRRGKDGQAFLERLAQRREQGLKEHPRLSGPGSPFHSFRRMFGPSTASNNWVVGGNHTATTLPLLSNDPHLQLMAPSIWILNHLESPSFQASGASFVGTPGVIIGHNGNISWGVTNVGLDCQDLFIMEGNHTHYKHAGAWKEYKVRNEIIRIKGHHADIPLQIRSSVYGPVISDLSFDGINDADLSLGPALSLRWTSLDANDTTFDAFLNINTAEDFDGWQLALERFVAPSQNMIYADADSNIGYQTTGRAPIRANNGTGLSPVPGTGEFDWLLDAEGATRWVPFADMPRMHNPNKSYVATANNAVVPPGYRVYLTGDWDEGSDGYRAKRITEMITGEPWTPTELALRSVGAPLTAPAANTKPPKPHPSHDPPKHTVSSMVEIQQDYFSGAAQDFQQFVLPLLLNDTAEGPQTPAGQSLLQAWAEWDCEMNIGTQEGAMFQRWYLRLQQLAGRETNNTYWSAHDTVRTAGEIEIAAPLLVAAWFAHSRSRLCLCVRASSRDDSQYLLRVYSNQILNDTNCRVGPAEGARASLPTCTSYASALIDEVASSSTYLAESWGQGSLHLATYHHQILTASPLACIADRSVSHGGDFSCVNVGTLDKDEWMGQSHGPSYRQVLDWADILATSVWVHGPGQSGNILSRNYDSLVSYWGQGQYLGMDPREYVDDILTLQP